MSRSPWNTVNPSSGSGDAVISIGGSVHTGRLQRGSTPTWRAIDVTDNVLTVTQKAKPEFVTINNVSATKEGGTVTVTGRSNSNKLTFSLGAGELPINLPANYSVAGANTENAVAIAGDPGATAEFDFSVIISVPLNDTISPRTKAINVVSAGGQSASSTISQPEGDPFLTLSSYNVTIEADGTPVSITVDSNTNWNVV